MSLLRCLYVALLAATVAGCGTPGEVVVTGTVTQNKEPLADASVTFHPEGETAGLGGGGRTGSDGKYTITPAKGGRTLPFGTYRVVVSRPLRPDGTPPPPGVPPIESDAKETLPAKYSSRDVSELKATVAKETPSYDFELTIPPKK